MYLLQTALVSIQPIFNDLQSFHQWCNRTIFASQATLAQKGHRNPRDTGLASYLHSHLLLWQEESRYKTAFASLLAPFWHESISLTAHLQAVFGHSIPWSAKLTEQAQRWFEPNTWWKLTETLGIEVVISSRRKEAHPLHCPKTSLKVVVGLWLESLACLE